MNFRAAERLGIYPMRQVVVVDDTPIGIEAGLNAGALTIAVSHTGNELGLSEAETAALPTAVLEARVKEIKDRFRRLGAHFVIQSVAELPVLLADIMQVS